MTKDLGTQFFEMRSTAHLRHMDTYYPHLPVTMLNRAQQQALSQIIEEVQGGAAKLLDWVYAPANWRTFTKKVEDKALERLDDSPRLPSLSYCVKHLDILLTLAQERRLLADEEEAA